MVERTVNNLFQIYDINNLRLVHEIAVDFRVLSLQFDTIIDDSSGSKTLSFFSVGGNRKIINWHYNMTSDETTPLRISKRHRGQLRTVEKSPRENFIVAAGADTTVYIYDKDLTKVTKKYDSHTKPVNTVVIIPYGFMMDSIVSAGEDGQIKVWTKPIYLDSVFGNSASDGLRFSLTGHKVKNITSLFSFPLCLLLVSDTKILDMQLETHCRYWNHPRSKWSVPTFCLVG